MTRIKPDDPIVEVLQNVEKGASLWSDAWHRLCKNRMAVMSLCIFAFIGILSLLAPWISPYEYDAQNRSYGAQSPSAAHWFGTDTLGRDLLTRVLYGGRVSIGVGFLATAVSLIIGVLYGATAGYKGGKIDAVMMRFVDILYTMPFIIFVIILMVIFGKQFWLLFVAIGAVEWLTMARIVRGQVMAIKQQEFVEAAVSLGYSSPRIILKHLIPNVLGPIIVYTTLTVPSVMLLEAVLSFLGLGVQPPMSSWGLLIKDGAEKMENFTWMLVCPAFFFTLTLFCLNFLGDGLRDALDPKTSAD